MVVYREESSVTSALCATGNSSPIRKRSNSKTDRAVPDAAGPCTATCKGRITSAFGVATILAAEPLLNPATNMSHNTVDISSYRIQWGKLDYFISIIFEEDFSDWNQVLSSHALLNS
jgi:hypothetical protein